MTVFSTQIHFLIVSIVAKLNIPVTKESVPTGRWWALHSALPGLLTAITEPELRVNRPREPWRSLALSSFLLSLSSVLLSTMRKADENPRFQQRFSSQVFVFEGKSVSPGIARSSLSCFGLSCWIISCVPGSSWWSQKRLKPFRLLGITDRGRLVWGKTLKS